MILLNPGPVTLSERVKRSLLNEDLCHRESEFFQLQKEIRGALAQVYPENTPYSAVLVTGSGTSAVEMMVGSMVPRNGKALILANGVYGERMATILKIQNKAVDLLEAPWTSGISLEEVEYKLKSDPAITHVLCVHHETTTGRLNDISAIGKLCAKYSKPLLLDAVSSFGGEELKLQEWNVLACAATANKCLHGVPGISFVLAREDALKSLSSGATSLYLDLKLQYQAQSQGSSPFTHSVQCCYALKEALAEFNEQGGWRARNARYRDLSSQVRNALKKLGVRTLISEECHSSILCSYLMPSGKQYKDLHDFLKSKGFTIYAGQGKFDGEIFRIAVMGAITQGHVDELIRQFEVFFK